MDSELIPSEMTRDLMPESLKNNKYYVGNDVHIKNEMAVREEIIEMQKDVDPIQAAVAKLYAHGQSLANIAKTLRISAAKLKVAVKHPSVVRLIHHWQSLEVLRDGPNEIQRKQMLWRIAVDNEHQDPKEARAALAELNKMAAPKGGAATGTFNIVINNDSLPRGPLDG